MDDFQAEKALVLDYYALLDQGQAARAAANFCAPSYQWRGFHPFHEMFDAAEVAQKFWLPLQKSLTHMQRRMDIFIAGRNQIDDFTSTWVVSMGHLMGLFDAPWLGIPPTSKMALLRYCEFHRVENGQITETAMYFDLPHLMEQAGLPAFPPQTAAQMVQPGPMTHKGLLFEAQDPAKGTATLAAINHMVTALGNWDNKLTLEQELALSWHDDMIWWGPTGIGATYTIARYAKQHAGPFRAAFSDRAFNGHIAKIAEGDFGGFFGWPNLTMTHSGPFMGRAATGKRADMRVIDMYRRDGDKLAENWIFIDLLHFWNQLGVDYLGQAIARVKSR